MLTRELQEFRVKYTEAGNANLNAREGGHDDLVLAIAIAVFGLFAPDIVDPQGVECLRPRLLGA